MENYLAALLAFALVGLLWWAIQTVGKATLERLVAKQFDQQMEIFKRDVWVREQSAKAAEYLANAWRLDAKDNPEVYCRVNQIGWELAIYASPEVYRSVRDAVANPSMASNVTTAIIAVRKELLGNKAGDLSADDIAMHVPNAARYRTE